MILFILLVAWSVYLVDGISHETCDIFDGAKGVPIGTHSYCSVLQVKNGLGCGTSNYSLYYAQRTGNCDIVHSVCDSSCFGFVGINLTYECFEGTLLCRYKDGECQYMSGSSVTYNPLLPEHAGLYECRNKSDHAIYTQSITVNEDVRIGSVDESCSDFGVRTSFDCCYVSSSWVVFNAEYMQRQYTVYGDPAEVTVTVQQLEWLVEKETRNDVDLGLYIERDSVNPFFWKVKIRTLPLMVTMVDPRVVFRVIANSTNSSHAMCDTFKGIALNSDLQVNTSLPKNTTVSEGTDALFQCAVSYLVRNSHTAAHVNVGIEVRVPFIEGNKTVRSFCSGQYAVSSYRNYTNCSSISVTRLAHTAGVGVFVQFMINIPKITSDLNGTSVTCLLLEHSGNLQWKKEAYVTVIEGDSPQSKSITVPLTATLTVTLVVIAVLLATTLTIVILRYRNNHRTNVVDPAEDPLISGSSEPSSPIDEYEDSMFPEVSEDVLSTSILGEQEAPSDNGPRSGIGWFGKDYV